MSQEKWNVTFRVYRQKGDEAPHYDSFELEVDPDEYVLDGVERIWAFKDRTLTYRHACHHSTCGACAMRVNGTEKLSCITSIRSVTQNGGSLRVEPLRNFPVVSDLVVDMGQFYRRMEAVGYEPVVPVEDAPINTGIEPASKYGLDSNMERLQDCIECGMCISACPIALTTSGYVGPAVLAAIQFEGIENSPYRFALADSADGAWRCHGAYECSAVCPSFVEPGWRIMDLRKKVVGKKIRNLFKPQKDVAK